MNTGRAQTRFAEHLLRWRENATAFGYELLGFDPDKWQKRALDAWSDPRQQRISLQACAGPGKTAVLAVMAWHFLSCFGARGEHPKGAATSVTGENLRDNLWAELRKWQARSAYLSDHFQWTATRVFARQHPETWFISTRQWPKTANPEEQGKTLSGLHSPYVAAFIDESGTIPQTVLRAAEQALSNTLFGKIVQAGNPLSLEGMLYAAANQLRHQWTIIIITGDPDDPEAWVHAPRVNQAREDMGGQTPLQWARDQIANYGRDNPWVMSYILGKFPPASINALLGIEDVQAAMKRHLSTDIYDWQQKRLGVDVARFGDDRTVIFPRQGAAAFRPIVMRNARTTEIAARVYRNRMKWGADVVLVDDTGHWGHGVIDNLTTLGQATLGIVFSGKALNPRYKNRRAEMWIEMADWVKAGGALPNVPELVAELTTPTYTFANGTFLLEEKDQIKLRLGRSPDLADALALTFAVPDMPNEMQARLQSVVGVSSQVPHEWNPYEDVKP